MSVLLVSSLSPSSAITSGNFVSNLELMGDLLDDFDFLERLPVETTDGMLLWLLADVDASCKLQSGVGEADPLLLLVAS
jgi:hypothetical protein